MKPIEELLRVALKEAIRAIQVFHGPGWEIYRDHSPEMKRWNALLSESAAQDAEAEDAFKRGQTEMRERAAQVAKNKYDQWRGSGAGITAELWDVHEAVRALPVEESK